MMDAFNPQWLILGVVPLVILWGWILNHRRAEQWDQTIRAHGAVHCRACGFVGELEVRSLSGKELSSSHLVLVCSQCNSPNWHVPDREKAG
ncbi:MAG TPA: hypothetical protein VEN81_03545 [Planctomycetota bacterium]|nr:hypothetical protein [Planctomycetota bacterium]